MRRRLMGHSAVLAALVLMLGGAAAGQMSSGAAQDHPHGPELGNVRFPVSCNAQAQERMNHALAMLHSFWFSEAKKTFESVIQADPSCGMAYWGIALTQFGNPFAGGPAAEGTKAGFEAAEKAAATGAGTEREKAYIEAVLTLYRDHEKLDNRARMQAYEAALAKLKDAYSDDTEAAIFHALMMVAT